MKKVNVKVNNKIVQLKEEEKLVTKFIIAFRKRKILIYHITEFSAIPWSLFRPDCTMLLDTSKITVMQEIKKQLKAIEVTM